MNKASKTIVSVLALAAIVAVGLVFYVQRSNTIESYEVSTNFIREGYYMLKSIFQNIAASEDLNIYRNKRVSQDWQIYEDKTAGYSVFYPPGFRVYALVHALEGNKKLSQVLFSKFKDNDDSKMGTMESMIHVFAYPDSAELSLEEWSKKNTSAFSLPREETKYKKITIAGMEALKYEFSAETVEVYFIKNKTSFVINLTIGTSFKYPKIEFYRNLFDKFLASLKLD